MELGLGDKVAFIAGGSRGIGLATALAFAAEGAKVAVAARGPEALAEARERLAVTAGRGRALAIEADMTSEADIGRAVEQTRQVLGGLHAVVANVGSGTGQPGYRHLDRRAWEAMLDVNLMSSVLVAGATLPHLTAQGEGTLCFVSSIAGMEAIGAPIPYGAAKAGLLAAMKGFARDVGAKGVRVNAVSPGNTLFEGGSWAKKIVDPDRKAFFEDYVRREVALQRFAAPNEIADVIVYLSSRRASFMTGSTVVVDGGQTRFVF
jgi:3-oxoacyl-[acyl-carrier protein] reductase